LPWLNIAPLARGLAGIFLQEDVATKDGYDVTMQTNYLSHFLLTKELFPLLQRARELRGEARVVNHGGGAQSIPATPLNPDHYEKRGGSLGGNGGGMMSGPRWERYHQSKLASAVFTLALRDRLGDGSGILATCADPGISATHIQVSASRSGGMGLMLWLFTELVYQSAEDGAMPILQACFDPGAASGDQYRPSGRMAFTGPAVKAEFDKLCSDPEARNVLWAKSEEACGKFEI
jgi:NAD(P)-dependent dehydrogenase (short-subunit alcohol dehydrogenase family)